MLPGSLIKRIGVKYRLAAMIFLVSLVIFSAGIRKSSIYIVDESRNAQCAWEMMHSDDHIIPTFNGQLRTDKPPLHYYFMMAGYSIWGKNAFAARFFSSFTGALLMLVLFLFVYTYTSRSVALWTLTSLLSSIHWVIEFHLSVPDPYLISFIGFGLMAFFHYVETSRNNSLFAMYICFSLAFTAKGPVAIALPGIIILLYLLLLKILTWNFIRKLMPLTGIAIFLLIAAPWYLLVWKATDGEWIKGFFLDHNINRFAVSREGHGGVFVITLIYFAVGLLPYFVFIWGVVHNAWINRHLRLILFSSLIVFVFLAFFSVSRTKLPNYAMPCFPFAAIILGCYLDKISDEIKAERMNIRAGLWILLLISVAVPAGLTFGVIYEPLISHIKTLGLWLAFMPVGIGLSIYFAYRNLNKKALYSVAATFLMASFVFNLYLMPRIDDCNPVVTNIETLDKANSVKYYRAINPSFIFNYGLIERLDDTAQVSLHLSKASNILITSEKALTEFPSFWNRYDVLYSGKDIFEANHTIIMKGLDGLNNQPE
ncbi:MAG: glycosyltransferase family 39 protein [Bacteroidales bacterium]|nr:glycosyltransferase family 39 protein [Bacteroidales bacterium]